MDIYLVVILGMRAIAHLTISLVHWAPMAHGALRAAARVLGVVVVEAVFPTLRELLVDLELGVALHVLGDVWSSSSFSTTSGRLSATAPTTSTLGGFGGLRFLRLL
jgi:hypothetical protein